RRSSDLFCRYRLDGLMVAVNQHHAPAVAGKPRCNRPSNSLSGTSHENCFHRLSLPYLKPNMCGRKRMMSGTSTIRSSKAIRAKTKGRIEANTFCRGAPVKLDKTNSTSP